MKKYSPRLSVILAATVLFALATPGVHAQENIETQEDVSEKFAKDKTGTNPLNFTYDARLYNEYRWLNTDGDGHQNLTTFEFRAPFASGKWQFRGKIRGVNLSADFNDDGTKDVDYGGFGDMDLRFMTVPYMNLQKGQAVAAGVEFFLDTASEDALGAGANSVAPFVFWAHFNPVGPGSIFVPGYQHTYSFDENEGRSQVNQGVIDMFLVKTWNQNQYWGYIDPQVFLDYEANEEFMLLELQGGMMLDKYWGTKGNSVWIMPSFGLGTDRPYDFSLEIGYKIIW